MSNSLTGDFDVVAEVRVEVLNRILATLHQNGADQNASPTLMHRLSVRIGDFPKKTSQVQISNALVGALGVIGGQGAQPSSAGSSKGGPITSQASQGTSSAAAAAAALADSKDSLDLGLDLGTKILSRGTAKVQLSSPTVSFPPGTTSEVTAHCHLRAHYAPDPGTPILPEPIHGEVQVTFTVERHPDGPGGTPFLEVTVPADDGKILFKPAPGSGLTSAQAEQIATEVRRFMRKKMEPINHELPEDLKLTHFKALGQGSNQAIALPVTLEGHVPAFAMDSVTNLFLKSSDDFGIAISRHYLDFLLEPALKTIKDVHGGKTWKFVGKTTAAYHFEVSTADLDWLAGSVVLVVTGKAWVFTLATGTTHYNFTIKQKLTLQFHSASQTVSLHADEEPTISGLPGIAVATAKKKIKKERDAMLPKAQSKIQSALTGEVNLDKAVRAFEDAAEAKLTALEIQPDGVVLRGDVSVKGRPHAVADYGKTVDGKAYTAWRSWIPAGAIGQYIWSWVTPGSQPSVPWAGVEHQESEANSFIKPVPHGLRRGAQICLKVVGTQIGSNAGQVNYAYEGEICCVEQPEWVAAMPSWWDTVMLVPVWGPDPGPEVSVEDAIVAHVNAVADGPSGAGPNALIQFTGNPSSKPLEALSQALLATEHKEAPVSVIVVTPRGFLTQTSAALAEKLGTYSRELSVPLAVTEDYEGAWSRALGASGGPATYLLTTRGQLAWHQAGPPTAVSIAAALSAHAIGGRARPTRLMSSKLLVGEPVPDFLFEHAEGRRIALRKLRGHGLLVIFWKSCSAPCLRELSRLRTLHHRMGKDGPVIVSIGDGEIAARVAEIRRQYGLTFTVAADPERRIARRYGVSCWPTTLWIRDDGLLEGVHLGATPDRSAVRGAPAMTAG